MIPLFLGLTASNLLMLLTTLGVGLLVPSAEGVGSAYNYHLALGVGAGLMTTLTHVAIYTYFMATTKWLAAATDKAGLNPGAFSEPARAHKRRAFPLTMVPILAVMGTMFSGAAADPTLRPWWPGTVHLAVAVAAVAVNLGAAMAQYQLIRRQSGLMDAALAVLNAQPPRCVEPTSTGPLAS